MEIGAAALDSGKASKDETTTEIIKAISVLEDRVKTELVHGTVKFNIDRLERKIEAATSNGSMGTGGGGESKGRQPIIEYNSIQNMRNLMHIRMGI